MVLKKDFSEQEEKPLIQSPPPTRRPSRSISKSFRSAIHEAFPSTRSVASLHDVVKRTYSSAAFDRISAWRNTLKSPYSHPRMGTVKTREKKRRRQGMLNSSVLGMKLNHYWLGECRQIFDMYDKNGDNVINVEELRGILEILGYSPSPEEVKTILERFDQDKSGTIDFDEYLVLIQHWIEQDEEQIYEAFKVFDKDGDGFVSAQELKRALTQYGEQFTEEEANEFFNMMDTDGDGVINYEEFVEYLRSMQKYSTE